MMLLSGEYEENVEIERGTEFWVILFTPAAPGNMEIIFMCSIEAVDATDIGDLTNTQRGDEIR